MRGVRTATAILAALAGCAAVSAFAQVDLRAVRQRNEILQQQDIARQNALAAQRQATAAQSRYETQLTLRALGESATGPAEPTLRPVQPAPPPRGPSAADMTADMERLDRLTDQALAAGNARLRAIKPAS